MIAHSEFETRSVGVWVLDAQTRTQQVNATMARMLGADRAAMLRQPILSFIPDQSHRRATAFFDTCRRLGTAQTELPFQHGDGSLRWGLVSTDFVAGSDTLACFVIDITERKRLEEALRRSEANYRVLAETAQDHIFVIARGDRVEYVNTAAAAQLRTTPDKIIGRLRTEIFPPDVAERQGHSLQRVFESGEPFYVEGRTLYLDREVWLGTWLAPVADEDGTVRAVLGVSRDITEQRRLQAELSHAQKLDAIGRLAGGIAHDFNNNLTAMLGYVEMVLARGELTEATEKDLKEVQQAGQRAAGLVRRLLAFGRRQVLQPTDLSLDSLIAGIKPMLARMLGEQVRIELALASAPWQVSGDTSALEQIVTNLALNARDAMPAGGTLTLETTQVTLTRDDRRPSMSAGRYVKLMVRDTGTGMDATTKELVFDPFFTTKPFGEATGLGLSTVYALVKQLNGSIWVESQVGDGSEFHVFLPATIEAGVSAADTVAEAGADPRASRRATVLLVEDEEIVRRYAKAALELHGFDVIVAATPEDALQIAAKDDQQISLMLTDVVMPRMSGPDLVARVRQSRPDIRVLYMSGYPATLVHGGLLDPSVRLLSKPFRTTELIAAIQEVIGGP